MPRIVLDMADRRPLLCVPAWAVEQLRAALAPGWSIVAIAAHTDGTGDGGRASPEALAAVAAAEVYLGFGVPAELLRRGTALRWVHTGTAGVGASLSAEMRARDVVFTNSAGVHAVPMAETVLAMILHFARGLDLALAGQAEALWTTARFEAADSPVREVAGSTVGIVGFGGIGRAVAARVRALGARVVALKRRPAGPVEEVEIVYGDAGFIRLLETSDFLVLAAPETPQTRGMIDAAALARLRPGAVLVNVARGALVDEAALLAALHEGRLRGAALDVFTTEPLPASHPLWRSPNVLIAPHVSAATHRFWEREAALLRENVERFLAGRPLLNVVDKRAGY